MNGRLPNFLIVGAAKSGTTSLYHYLRQHPDVYLPEMKEPRFFISEAVRAMDPRDPLYESLNQATVFDYGDYARLFEGAKGKKAIGEASVGYLYRHEVAIRNIRQCLGSPRIIIILRNPVERAFSGYLMHVRDDHEHLSFERALEAEDESEKRSFLHAYKGIGFYYRQVRAYLESFDQVHVCLYDDLKRDAVGLMASLFDFLGVEPSLRLDTSRRHNISGIPRSRFIHRLIYRPSSLRSALKPMLSRLPMKRAGRRLVEMLRARNLKTPEMNPHTRKYLTELYREDLLYLQDLIGRDLSPWLS